MKIAIIGAGFLGCSLSLVLSKKNEVDLYEKTGSILSGASSYNQMRFHGGYHYPRSHKTRQLCIEGYYKFVSKYGIYFDKSYNKGG